jgi:hypothetical protein
MKMLAAGIILIAFTATPLHAENCSKSRDYLLGSLGGDLVLPPQAYRDLFTICLATINMSNVKDAYILKDGGIAVVPKQDGIAATASTLSAFCGANPRSTLRFLTRKDLVKTSSLIQIIQLSSTSSTPCRKINGNSSS